MAASDTSTAILGSAPLLGVSGGSPASGRLRAALVSGTALLAAGTLVALVSVGRRGAAGAAAGSGSGSGSAVAATLLEAADAPEQRVRIDVYGMAGCPFTRAFIEGPLSETIDVARDLVRLEVHAFGNSYHPTKQCGGTAEGMPYASYNKGYNQTIRECWDARCGVAAKEPAEDCFSGPLVCQHGTTDGMMTKAWACAKRAAAFDAPVYMPFMRCTSLHFLGVTSEETFVDTVSSCARDAGIEPHEVLACSTQAWGDHVLREEARNTVAHPSVPYVLIDGKVLDDTKCVACGDGILNQVCDAWRARGRTATPMCKGIFGLI